jgi:hypothetical protein
MENGAPFICRDYLLETYYPFSIVEAEYIFFRAEAGICFLPSGYFLSVHKIMHLLTILFTKEANVFLSIVPKLKIKKGTPFRERLFVYS